jgi:hypothetical protein
MSDWEKALEAIKKSGQEAGKATGEAVKAFNQDYIACMKPFAGRVKQLDQALREQVKFETENPNLAKFLEAVNPWNDSSAEISQELKAAQDMLSEQRIPCVTRSLGLQGR